MPTPLFPENEITFKQGKVGDCYFLASLDCIFNSGPEGREKIKSLFTETSEGITVRIKRSSIATHLKPEKLKGKYDYHYDGANDEDVFILSKARIAHIDADDSIGVKSNSLAVKILERLSSYYYVKNWDHSDLLGSVKAHNVDDGLGNRHSGTETAFVGNLVGVEFEDLNDVDFIIKLKSLIANFPIYISMRWGKLDEHGNSHSRHALRIDRIVADSNTPGGYKFVLVNPWNNQITEDYTAADIRRRAPKFCLFSTNQASLLLSKHLVALPRVDADMIIRNPKLLHLLQHHYVRNNNLTLENVKQIVAMYQKMPCMGELFQKLSGEEQVVFFQCLDNAKGDKDTFIAHLFTGVPRIEVLRQIMANQVLGKKAFSKAIELCMRSQDLNLYGLLAAYELPTLINGSTLEVDEFLTRMLAFEKAKSQLDFKRLKAIVVYIKKYNELNPTKLLTINFDEEALLDLVVQRAIISKTKELRGNSEQAKLLVEDSLVAFYVHRTADNLVAAGGLRVFFKHGICSPELIERMGISSWEIHAIPYFLNAKNLPEFILQKIRQASDIFSATQLDTIYSNVEQKNPMTLFHGLFALNKLNPAVAKRLHHFLMDKLGSRLDGFINLVKAQSSGEFRLWFLLNCNSKGKETKNDEAKSVISGCLEHIQTLPFSFRHFNNAADVCESRDQLFQQLTGTLNEPELLGAKDTLLKCGVDVSSSLQEALNEKLDSIQKAAEERLQFLQATEDTLNQYLKTITNPVSFDDAHSCNEVECLLEEQVYQLNAVMKARGLLEVQYILGKKAKTKVNEVYNQQLVLVQEADEKQHIRIVQAERVVEEFQERIKDFSVSFNGLNDEKAVNEHCNSEIDRLYKLTASPAIVEAESILGSKDHHSILHNEQERRAQLIIKEAEVKLRELEDAREMLSGAYRQIHDFPIDYSKAYAPEEVRVSESQLLEQLQDSVDKNSDLKRAHEILGINGLCDNLQEALASKKAYIVSEAEKRTYLLKKSQSIVHEFLTKLEQVQIDFNACKSQIAVQERAKSLQHQLQQFRETLKPVFPYISPETRNRIDHAVQQHRSDIQQTSLLMQRGFVAIELNKLLHNNSFLEHLFEIQEKAEGLEQNKEHKEAANKLYRALDKAKKKLLFIPTEGEVPSAKAKTAIFKHECKIAINEAMIILKEDSSWRQLLINMIHAVAKVGNFFRTFFVENPYQMFAERRESAKIVRDLYQDMLQITVGA